MGADDKIAVVIVVVLMAFCVYAALLTVSWYAYKSVRWAINWRRRDGEGAGVRGARGRHGHRDAALHGGGHTDRPLGARLIMPPGQVARLRAEIARLRDLVERLGRAIAMEDKDKYPDLLDEVYRTTGWKKEK